MSERELLICRLRYEGRRREDDRVFEIGDRSVTLGRAADCDLVLNHESVSRAHCRFSRDGEGWKVADLNSKNGVRVNTFPIKEERLTDGDRIDLGVARLHVEIVRQSAETQRPRVVFQEKSEPGLHTEILEMNGLTSLLSPVESHSLAALPGGDLSELGSNLAHIGDESAAKDAGDLIQLVGEAAEALISCNGLDETLDRILALVFDNLPVERGVICLRDEETGQSEPKAMRTVHGVPAKPMVISTNIANHVTGKKQALLVRDTQMDDRFGQAESVIMMAIHSAMCAPLIREGRVAGFIYVDRQKSTEPLNNVHLQVLSALALMSAVAIEQSALRDSIQHEQQLRGRLARYSSPAVVDRILQAPGTSDRGMVAEERDVTVLFADLTGFTSMAESMPSAEVIRMLNRVFERLTEAVFTLEGTLDKFRGDGMMAFFGAPLPMPDHAARAVDAALRMQRSLAELNTHTLSMRDLRMRIGINSGAVVVGDIGSPQRKDYTVIGDVVNTASRIESHVAKPGQVVIGRATYEQIKDEFLCEALPKAQVKGKQREVEPFLVIERRQR